MASYWKAAYATNTGYDSGETDLISKKQILQSILTSLPFLIDIANAAANVSWPSLLELEGYMICWDPLHLEYLLTANPWPTTQTYELFLR